ncbi:sce7726 family protein [Jatrophihabitans sp.]|uniref:sce7726 family protein n=1 Tax=Jatrophihabitans sp. TaxID=1932789 RepID=UPI002BF5A4E3|nr:sce7726 family protein [Jatrophihabitans sp.]
MSHLDVLEAAYASMTANYRSEYVYRNLITNRIFLGRHRASSGTAFLNEFRVGASVADCVLVNGHATVYEIKTELDRPGPRLQSQLDSYYRAFPLVNVVVHEAHVPRYVDALEGTAVGVLSVGRRWRLSVVRPAIERMDEFDTKVLFNLLRAGEVEQALHAWFGEIPDVPNGIRYREHFTLAQRIPPLRFQSLVHGQLRMRGYRGHPAAILSPRLKPLRALLVQLQPNVAQYRYLLDWLERAA